MILVASQASVGESVKVVHTSSTLVVQFTNNQAPTTNPGSSNPSVVVTGGVTLTKSDFLPSFIGSKATTIAQKSLWSSESSGISLNASPSLDSALTSNNMQTFAGIPVPVTTTLDGKTITELSTPILTRINGQPATANPITILSVSNGKTYTQLATPILTIINGETLTEVPITITTNGQTFTELATPMETIINGETYVQLSIPSLTLDEQTLTPSLVPITTVLNGETYTELATPFVTVINGQTYTEIAAGIQTIAVSSEMSTASRYV